MSILAAIYNHDRRRIAARAGETVITYGRLCDDIDSMTHFLLGNHGLEPGDRVSLHLFAPGNTNYWEWILHLGAIRAGLVHSTGPIPSALEAKGVLRPYKAAIGAIGRVDSAANPERKIRFVPRSSIPLSEQIEIKQATGSLDGLEQQAVRLLSTSGTTGLAKVIRWNAELFEARLKQVRDTGDITPDSAVMALLGLITTTGLRYPLATWQLGGIVLLPAIGSHVSDLFEFAGASSFFATSPFRMQAFLRNHAKPWPAKDKRVIELFGGRVPPVLHQRLLADCCRDVRMSYGATEVGRVAAGDAALTERHAGAVGRVEPGITVEIVDSNGTLKPSGERGLLRIKSDFMTKGYVGQPPQQSAGAPFANGWFHPGDVGILYEDGVLAIEGRASETINIAGAKLSAIQIEDRLRGLPEVKDVCVTPVQLDAGDLLTAAVVCDESVDFGAVRAKISALMPAHYPFTVVRVMGIPRNAMGRIPRAAFALDLTAAARKIVARANAAD